MECFRHQQAKYQIGGEVVHMHARSNHPCSHFVKSSIFFNKRRGHYCADTTRHQKTKYRVVSLNIYNPRYVGRSYSSGSLRVSQFWASGLHSCAMHPLLKTSKAKARTVNRCLFPASAPSSPTKGLVTTLWEIFCIVLLLFRLAMKIDSF